MTYQFIAFDKKSKRGLLYGTFSCDIKKMFLFASYLLGSNEPEKFYVLEQETGRVCKLTAFANHYNITKELVKNPV